MLLFAAVGSAFAYSTAGFGLPVVGGGFSGPAARGVYGVPYSPAATVVDRPHLVMDVATHGIQLSEKLDRWNEVLDEGFGLTLPVPFIGVATPAGPVSVGLTAFIPYVRLGDSEPDGPQRYYTIEGALAIFEQNLTVGWSPIPEVRLGAALRIGQSYHSSFRNFDTGALILGALSGDTEVPLKTPLLEGRQNVHPMWGAMASWAVGGAYERDGWGLHVAYRPRWNAPLKGEVTMQPSLDLTAEVQADIDAIIPLPAQAYAALVIPVGHITVVPELGWIGWQPTSNIVVNRENVILTAQDPVVAEIFTAYGLNETDMIPPGQSVWQIGFEDVLNLGVRVQGPDLAKVSWMGGAFWQPASIVEEHVHPSNLDFSLLDLRGGVGVEVTERLRLMGALDLFLGGRREVNQTVVSLYRDASTSNQFPDPKGEYALTLGRLGITAEVRLGDLR